jgi:AcrR family transcriptional regulator
MEKSNANNRQVKRTRSWIFDALLALMDEKPYNEISVSDIVEKAGIARQTFYRSFNNKDDVILQFFDELFNLNPVKVENIFREGGRGIIKSTMSLGQFVKYANVLKRILNAGTEHLIYRYCQIWERAITDLYTGKLPGEKQLIFNYVVKYQNAGTMNIIIDWIKNDMPLPVEVLADILHHLTSPFDLTEHALRDTLIPHLVLNIQTEE